MLDFDRLVDLFPRDREGAVRTVLARTLRGVVCQRLLRRAGGRGRVVTAEILVVNGPVGQAIADGRDASRVEQFMSDGEYYGMQTFDQAIARLYTRGLVEGDVALDHASYAPALRLELERADRGRDRPVTAPV